MEKIGEFRRLLIDHLKESKETDKRIIRMEAVQEQYIRASIHDETKHEEIAKSLEELLLNTTEINTLLKGNNGVVNLTTKHEKSWNMLAGAGKLTALISILSGIIFGAVKLL